MESETNYTGPLHLLFHSIYLQIIKTASGQIAELDFEEVIMGAPGRLVGFQKNMTYLWPGIF